MLASWQLGMGIMALQKAKMGTESPKISILGCQNIDFLMFFVPCKHGANVVISSRKQDQLEETANELNSQIGGKKIVPIAANAGRKEDLSQLVEGTNKAIGKIDVLIGNAGVNPHYGPMSAISDEAFDKTMATNVKSNHWLCQMVAPDMVARGGGSIMITSSVGAFEPSLQLGTYAISKLAVIGLVRNLAAEYGSKKIRVK